MVDNQQVKIFSDQELEQTAAWIKTIGLDIDFTKFTPNQCKQIVQSCINILLIKRGKCYEN